MFVVFFLHTFVLVTVYAVGEIPFYIHVCGRNDPNYNQCFADNVNNVISKICTEGMPEFNIPPIELLNIDKIVIFDTDNLKLNIQDLKISGFCNMIITSFYISPEKLHFEFNFILNNLKMDSIYNFDVRLLVQLAHKGLAHVFANNMKGKVTTLLKEVTKNNKKQLYVLKTNTVLNIEKFNYEFDESDKNLVQLLEVIRKVVNENEKEIVKIVTPALEAAISNLIISIANKVIYNRYEQLFPEETPKIV